jgi:3-dehydroquinate dehydratase / shikimate dehydrogenase
MATPELCVTVTAPTMADLRRQRDAVVDADLVELRLDKVRDPNVAGALEGRTRPVVITCRAAWEGGGFTGSEDERRRILSEALEFGADYVDIEWRARFDDLVNRGGRRVVLSSHNFDGMTRDLPEQLRVMRGATAGIAKVAVTPQRLADCAALLALGAEAVRDSRIIVIGMGDYGLATRLLAGRFGSAWTYAGALRDIGQVTASSLLNEYRLRAVSDTTAIYGIVGGSVMHSVSPSMHNAAFVAAGIDAVYLPLPAVDADDFLAFGRAIGISGASVTIPHKVSLFERVDEVDTIARRIGAINTIRVVDGRWVARNTDANGFLHPLKDRVDLEGRRAAILGAGGAARAVAVALASGGCTVRVHARQRPQAEEVAALVAGSVGPWPPEPGSWDLLVNCTPIGMYPNVDDTPLPAERLTGSVVYDLVYNPPATRLLREAAARGCRTIGGLDMLVGQAHEQFTWWTGAVPPAGVMRQAADRRLTEFTRNEDYVV